MIQIESCGHTYDAIAEETLSGIDTIGLELDVCPYYGTDCTELGLRGAAEIEV